MSSVVSRPRLPSDTRHLTPNTPPEEGRVPVINTNIPALAAEFNLGQTGDAIMKSIHRLSSGLVVSSRS